MLLSQGYLAQDQQHSPNENIGVSSLLLHQPAPCTAPCSDLSLR